MAANARSVHLDHGALQRYAATFPVAEAKYAAARDRIAGGPEDAHSVEARIALCLSSVAVNFTSGWHDIMSKRAGCSGAVSTVNRLVDFAAEHGPLTPDLLMAFSVETAERAFETEPDQGPLSELLVLLTQALNELGTAAEAAGGFEAFVAEANGSATSLAAKLAELSSFADITTYRDSAEVDHPVEFFKRAQMAAATLFRQFRGIGPGSFDDIDQLTIFADNLVPHVLRLDGVLHYEPDLLARIEHGQLLRHGSPEEVEIRACGVHAAELIVAEISNRAEARSDRISAAVLDHALWSRGGLPTYKAEPRHRCRNPFY